MGNGDFYRTMGKYFAEKEYKDQLPYISNQEGDIWFIAYNHTTLVGFMAINEIKTKITLKHVFVEEKYRDNGVCKEINKYVFDYIKKNMPDKPLEVATKNNKLLNFYLNNGFKIHRETKNYKFLRKEVDNNES